MKRLSILMTMLFLANFSSFAKNNEADTIKTQNIDEVVISASRTKAKLKELPSKVEVITKKAISQSGANDMTDLLKNNTSVDVIQYPNFLAGIGMRGFAPSTSTKYVTILVDGVPAGTMNMGTLMLNGVEQVEILKGPFSSLYGSSAMGGLINIVPVQNKGNLTGNVNLGYGSWKTLKTSAAVGGKISEGLSFDLNAYYNKQGDDYKVGGDNFFSLSPTKEAILDKKTYDATMERTSYKAKGGNLRLGYDFNENWNLNVYGMYFSTDDIVTNGSFWGVYAPNAKDMEQYTTRLSLEGRINNHLIKVNPYYSRAFYDNTDVKTNYKTYESTIKTYGAQLQDIISIGKHKLTIGLDNQNVDTEGKSFESKDGKEKAPYQPNYSNGTLAAFAQANLKLFNDAVNLSAGARYDHMKLTLQENEFMKNAEKSETYNKFSPNLGLKINIDEYSTIHASYGQAYLAPDAYQKAGEYTGLYGTTKGNPDLKGESSTTFDVGVSYNNFRQGVAVDITYFHTNHDDFIVSDKITSNGSTYKSFKNAQEAKMRGIEVMASYDFGSLADYAFSLKAYMNGTFMLKTKVYDEQGWQDINYVRKQTINMGLHFITENKWDIKLNGRYIGSRIENNWYTWYPQVRPSLAALAMQTQPQYASKDLLKHPQFMVFDAHVYYNITKNIKVGVNANNLLDENYTEKDGYNMPGRNFLGKISYQF